jgi:DNA-binding NtrC family response regulator
LTEARKPRVLVVDDEVDVLEIVTEELGDDYQVDTANSYRTAHDKLEAGDYDVVILDIMGVNGHELLEIHGGDYPCIMLTAHALTIEALARSVRDRARLFLPKDELYRLGEYVDRVLSTRKPLWGWLFEKLDFRRTFGPEFMAANFLRRMAEEGALDPDDRGDDEEA